MSQDEIGDIDALLASMQTPEDEGVDDMLLESFKKKKGKKGKKAAATTTTPEEGTTTETTADATPATTPSTEYSYIELLDRAFQQVRAANPDADKKTKTTLPIPVLTRGGPRKTIWNNFKNTCDLLQRSVEHVQQFVVAELGAETSLDATQQLIIRGKYTAKHAESLLKTYIQEYVACSMCHSPNTTLTKDPVTRLHYIECNVCSVKRSVAQIKSGFHATSRADRQASRRAQ